MNYFGDDYKEVTKEEFMAALTPEDVILTSHIYKTDQENKSSVYRQKWTTRYGLCMGLIDTDYISDPSGIKIFYLRES